MGGIKKANGHRPMYNATLLVKIAYAMSNLDDDVPGEVF
jgi:hypothetical protein